MMRIEGVLTTRSPMTIGAPGEVRVDLSGRRTAKGFPASVVAKYTSPGLGEEHEAITYPVVSANTLRGLLRRAGAQRVEKALIDRSETITLATYHALRCGTPYGHPDKVVAGLDEIQRAQATPPLGVFGGGPRMMAGASRIDTGFPLLAPLIDRGIVSQRHLGQAIRGERLSAFFFLRRSDDAASFIDQDLAAHVIVDYEQSIDAWQQLVGRVVRDGPEELGADGETEPQVPEEDLGQLRGLQALNAFEAVVPGVPFTFSIDLDTEHAASQGYMLLALETFANNQRLGGRGNLGFGRFHLDVQVTMPDGTVADVFERADSGYTLSRSSPVVAQAIESAEDWLKSVVASDLDSLMLPSETSRDNVRKRLKGEADAEKAFDQVFGK